MNVEQTGMSKAAAAAHGGFGTEQPEFAPLKEGRGALPPAPFSGQIKLFLLCLPAL